MLEVARQQREAFKSIENELQNEMKLEDVNQAVETIQTLDEQRREVFEREHQDTANSECSFNETRQIILEEQAMLTELNELLEVERDNIDELVDETDFLTVNQAVEHRDQTISKITERNEQLRRFHDTMSEALSIVESNLDTLEEEGGETTFDADPTPYLEDAQAALQKHNEAISGLEKNLKILNAYLL